MCTKITLGSLKFTILKFVQRSLSGALNSGSCLNVVDVQGSFFYYFLLFGSGCWLMFD